MIKIYPSTLPGEPLETHHAQGVTLEQWLSDNVPSFRPGPRQPISATVNGVVAAPEDWQSINIEAGTIVELRPQPGEPTTIIAAVVAIVAVAASILLAPSIPSQNRNRSRRGSSIYEANAQGNSPKLGDVIPEIAGRHKTFPDYLTAPRRFFSAPKEQSLDLLLCIGRGEFDIDPGEIRIGQTPIESLGGNVDYQIFGPGESVTSHPAHSNWYNAPEVGGSVGASGLRLRSTRDLAQSFDGELTFDGTSITSPDGSPESWDEGVILRIALPIDVEVTGGDGEPNVFEGYFRHIMPEVDADIRLYEAGATTAAFYRIRTYTAGNPDSMTLERLDLDTNAWETVTDWAPGSYTRVLRRSAALNTDPDDYRIESADDNGITVAYRLDGSIVPDWAGFPNTTVSNAVVEIDDGEKAGIWTTPFLACPKGETTSRIEFDVFAPQGLGYIEDDGDISSRTRTIEMQYRPLGSSTWTTVSKTASGATRDQLGWTWAEDIAEMTPEVRLRRVSAESNSTQALDRFEWYGLRSKLDHKPSYPGVTVLALTLIGSDTIASQTENQVSVVATRKLPVRVNGSWQPAQATRDIAPWLVHVAKSIGYDDSQIDYDELDRLDATWKARGDYYDRVHDDDSTVKEVLNSSLRAGMSELTIDQGRLRPVRDEPRSTLEHMYTPQNMTGPLKRSVTAPRPDDPDGVDVEYFSDETWSSETVECRLPGDQGIKVEKLSVDGVTSRTQAWQIGMRERRRMKYRRWQYSFETELDALNSRYMSYAALADDVPGYGQSAWLKAVDETGDGEVLTVSEPLEWADGESHVIAWRRPDGTLAGPYPATQGDDECEVIASLDELPDLSARQEPPHILFGTTECWSYPVLISDINPQGFESVSVEAVNYSPDVYLSDNDSPPN